MTVSVLPTPDEQPTAAPTDAVNAAPYIAPDRADAPVSEVTERFLKAVIAQIPVEQIEELHLFSPLRQGTVETGIAVIAARVPLVVVDDVASVPESALELEFDGEAVLEGESIVEAELEDAVELEAHDDIDAELEASDDASDDAELDAELDADVDAELVDAMGTVDVETDETVEAIVDATVDASVDVSVDASVDEVVDETVDVSVDALDESPYADDVVARIVVDDAHVEAVGVEMPVAEPVVRHTVYTARYRYVIKGPERGKWEASVKAEADAPLITVETVVRGVQRRAGEESEIVRYTGAQVARALRLPQ